MCDHVSLGGICLAREVGSVESMKTTDPRKSRLNKLVKDVPSQPEGRAGDGGVHHDTSQKPATNTPAPSEERTGKARNEATKSHVKELIGLLLL